MTEQVTSDEVFITPEQFLRHWQGHRSLTRRVIEAFPDDQLFVYRVAPMRTFGELVHEMLHMTVPTATGAVTGKWEEYGGGQLPRDKAGLLELWDKDTEKLNELWAKISPARLLEHDVAFGQWPGSVWSLVQYAVDNEIHHRAQGYVYLRALGVEPPPFWER
jgi:uncharacterized damage-inducible protein DinB